MTITPEDFEHAGDFLSIVARFDRRTTGEADVEAWAVAITIAELTWPEAKAAAVAHFSDPATRNVWLMPADVVARAKAARKQRLDAAGPPDYPPDLSWEQEREWRGHWLAGVHAGVPDPRALADAAMGVRRPELIDRGPNAVRALVSGVKWDGRSASHA